MNTGDQDRAVDMKWCETEYVLPQKTEKRRAFPSSSGTHSFVIEDGRLYRQQNGGEREEVCAELPSAEWYDVVHFVQSPVDPMELWLAISGRNLYRSKDGGRTFKLCKRVKVIGDVSFVPSRWQAREYTLCLLGGVEGQGKGFFTTDDDGWSWKPLDLTECFPIL